MPIAAGRELDRVLAVVAARSDCRLLPPAGQARVTDGLSVPDDLRRFHERCGGAVLFTGTEYPLQVGVPDRVVAASPRLLTPEIAAGIAVEDPHDLTNSCFVIADGGRDSSTDPAVVVDLHPDRLGRCYVAFWDTFGVAGEMPVIAVTMDELLRVLLEHEGQVTALPDRYGDAYEPRLPLQPKQTVDLDMQWPSLSGPVLRRREVGETAAGVFDGERVEESAPDLRAFLTGLHGAATAFARTGDIAGL